MKKIMILPGLLLGIITLHAQTSYTPVDAGSKVHFVIKNFGMKTGGDFTGLKGTIKFSPEHLNESLFDVTVDANTIDTDNKSRDGHLRKTEYFNVATYKTLHFKSNRITRSVNAGRFYIFGILTIKGVSKPVEFGFSATANGNDTIFEGEFEINRRDFGVGGNSMSMADKLKVVLTVVGKR